ncbi:serine/threonine-protein kinase [Streptomonospora nanhaiensis]|uniref:serine/threonine-protein kinase n=1 Tax=Streptomonospora nanhaiensis TaxID=1323731 RepID=UPI001C38219F|nr:serine/threonine-protein kinase [Streptomonospora nanhaiensis]MBV2365481.1 protein kinase [Streptomonospora nanhaiensis]
MTDNGHERVKPLRTGDPHQLGDYRIEGRLGRGGMGTVYLAKDTADRLVAVKLIHPDLADDPDFRRRFAREVEAARRVARFSTAGVLDARLDGDPLFIVSEYVPGPNLAEAVATDGPMRGGTLESLAMGVAAALTAIHRAGVIHRDLKPANVLLSAVGPKVIDFGIARAMDDEGAVTRSSQLMGTPAYLAPELIAGGDITPASDIFSWGCLVTYAGTGKAPFNAQTVPAILHLISAAPADLEGLEPGVTDLVRSALDKDPANRPTAQELLNTLVGQENPAETTVDRTVVRSWTPPSTARPGPGDLAGAAGAAALGAAGAAAAAGAVPGADSGNAPTVPAEPPGAGPTRALPPETAEPAPPTRPSGGTGRPDSGPQAPPEPAWGASGAQPPPPGGPGYGPPPAGEPAAFTPPPGVHQQPHGPWPGHTPWAGHGAPSGPQAPGHGFPSGPQPGHGMPSGPQPGHGLPSGPQPPMGGPGGPGGPGTTPPGPGPSSGRPRTRLIVGAAAGVVVLVAGVALGAVLLSSGPPEGTQIYETDFQSDTWGFDAYDPENEYLEYGIHPDHGLILRVEPYNDDASIGAFVPYDGVMPEAVRVEAEAEIVAGEPYSEFGTRCYHQVSDDDVTTHYEAFVRFDGADAQIRRYGGDAGDSALASTGDVPGYVPAEGEDGSGEGGDPVVNTVTMTCEPDGSGAIEINMWVNGEHVLEATDADPLPDDATEQPPRQTGITVKRRGNETNVPEVGFHRVEVQRLGDPEVDASEESPDDGA